MSDVRVAALLGPDPDHLHQVHCLVDTSLFNTLLPRAYAGDLGLAATLMTARAEYGIAYLKLMNRDLGILFVFADIDEPTLGFSAIDGLGLKLNPIIGTLEYDRPFAAGALLTGAA